MENKDELARGLKKLYVHLQQIGLYDFFKSNQFDLFCEDNGLEKSKDSIVTSLHQEFGIPVPLKQSLTTSGKIIVDFSNFPEALVKPFLKELLIEIYRSKNLQFVEIVVSFLTYYSQYNRDFRDGKPTPIDDNLMRKIALDLINLSEGDDDVRMFFELAGYDLDALLPSLNPEYSEIRDDLIFKAKENASANSTVTNEVNIRKIFVVHGHDHGLLGEVEEYLESLNLKPIVLNKQVDLGKTIIEKVEYYVAQTSYAIVILTKDDFGVSKRDFDIDAIREHIEEINSNGLLSKLRLTGDYLIEDSLDTPPFGIVADLSEEMLKHIKPRARQNVIFELGLTFGHLGRNKVKVLYEEGVELPTDIRGLAYTSLGEDWKKKLAQEINAAGISIDIKFL